MQTASYDEPADKAATTGSDDDTLTALHPNYVKATRISAILFWIPLIIAAGFAEFQQIAPNVLWPGVFIVPVLILAAFFILRLPLRRYHARGYARSADRLRVVRGLMFHSDTIVPFGRVQHIDVDQGPLERYYGIATLTLHTAGNHNSSVSLPGLAHKDALAMRETIRAAIKRDSM